MYKITLDNVRISSANYKSYENARKALRRYITNWVGAYFDAYTQFGFQIKKV